MQLRMTVLTSPIIALWSVAVLMLTMDRAVAEPYALITEAEVVGLKLNHYFNAQGQSQTRDFEWTFTKTEFTIRKGKGAIPADLVKKLLPDGATADVITGKWNLLNKNGQHLVLSGIKAGDRDGKKEDVKISIFRTAPTVIRIGDPQYVFERTN